MEQDLIDFFMRKRQQKREARVMDYVRAGLNANQILEAEESYDKMKHLESESLPIRIGYLYCPSSDSEDGSSSEIDPSVPEGGPSSEKGEEGPSSGEDEEETSSSEEEEDDQQMIEGTGSGEEEDDEQVIEGTSFEEEEDYEQVIGGIGSAEEQVSLDGQIWIVDSGANRHCTGNMGLIKNRERCNALVELADKRQKSITIKGKAKMSCTSAFSIPGGGGHQMITRTFNLSNVFYLEHLPNVLSVGKFTEEHKCSIKLLRNICIIEDSTARDEENVVTTGEVRNDMYMYAPEEQEMAPSAETAGIPNKPLSILCRSFKDIDMYTTGFPRGNGQGRHNIFPAVKRCLPGPYTFILTASKELPKQCARYGTTTSKYGSRKNIGIRIPDDTVCKALLEKMDAPLISASVKSPKENEWILDPVIIADVYGKEGLDFVVAAGTRFTDPSTVVDMTGSSLRIVRQGKGPIQPWMDAADDEDSRA